MTEPTTEPQGLHGPIEVTPVDDVGTSTSGGGVAIWVGDRVLTRLTWEQARSLNTLLCVEIDLWLHSQGLRSRTIDKAGTIDFSDFDDVDMSLQAEQGLDETTEEAQQRATESADRIFADTGLDKELDADAYDAVQSWFQTHDQAIQAMERGEDDGCPCEKCSEHWAEERARKASEQAGK